MPLWAKALRLVVELCFLSVHLVCASSVELCIWSSGLRA